MNKIIFILLIFVQLFSHVVAKESKYQAVDLLYNNDTVDIIANYRQICQDYDNTLIQLSDQFEDICDIVMKSELCQNVEEDKLFQCRSIKTIPAISSQYGDVWDFMKGCTSGGIEVIKDMVFLVRDLIKWINSKAITKEEWRNISGQISEVLNISKLYLHTEFEKAYAQASPPNRKFKAIKQIAKNISSLIITYLSKIIGKIIDEYKCCKYEIKTKILCKFIGDFITSPLVLTSLLKNGFKTTIKQFPKFKKAVNKLNELRKDVIKKIDKTHINNTGVVESRTIAIEHIIQED